MSLINSTAIPSGATAYELEQSLRFEDSRSTFLSRTPAAAGNRKTWTLSYWIKRSSIADHKSHFGGSVAASESVGVQIQFDGNTQQLQIADYRAGYHVDWLVKSNAGFRDTSAWYHIVIAVDTTQSTASNRVKLYANGELLTLTTYTAPDLNEDTKFNTNTIQVIGGSTNNLVAQNFWEGYMSEVNFLDGVVASPTNFGETGDYGEWKPIEYSGSYGTNGYYLPFKQDYTVEGFSAVTYKGNGGTQYIGGTGFQPDFTWIKRRNSSQAHSLIDSVRGGNKMLESQSTGAEASLGGGMAFKPDGFTLDQTGGWNEGNANGDSYVAWNWDMGGSNATNTDGSITSLVRANTAYGQSIVTYTGTGSNATVGHGLSSAPEMIISFNRGGGQDHDIYHASLGATKYLRLSSTVAAITNSGPWNNTTPTSSVISLGNRYTVNQASRNIVLYCFHSVTGYSKFGNYTGGGGTHVTTTTGFAPAFVMVKNTTSATNWEMFDNVRNPTAPQNLKLGANLNVAENGSDLGSLTQNNLEFLSNGFKTTGNYTDTNQSGSNFIYMAFADKREYAYWLDQSGNNNDWTSNNLTESDISVDSPTNNFATLNSLGWQWSKKSAKMSEGNLSFGKDGTDWTVATGTQTIPQTKKIYFEVRGIDTLAYVGIALANENSNAYDEGSRPDGGWTKGLFSLYIDSNTSAYAYRATTAGTALGTQGFSGSNFNNAVVGVAVDIANSNIKFFINNTEILSQSPGNVINNDKDYVPIVAGNTNLEMAVNFGQDSSFAGAVTSQGNQDANDIGDFFYAPPSGYLALCTKNLPESIIPSKYFKALLYTGNGTTGQSITGVGFKSDFSWFKARANTAGSSHRLFDAVRGVTHHLRSNTTGAETTDTELTSFDADGFTIDDDGNGSINDNNIGYVSFNWKVNGSGSTNTAGTINSTVSANGDAGISVVSWTGTGANATVGHGLSIAPELILFKNRTSSVEWQVYDKSQGNGKYGVLNTAAAFATSAIYQNTSPTASLFSIGNFSGVNTNSANYVAYCFHSVAGYSRVGSYVGNGNNDGTFVYTGFRPAFVMAKVAAAGTHGWAIYNSASKTYNYLGNVLQANGSNAEMTSEFLDFTSNGFKHRTSSTWNNGSGATYIYLAFAETPFKYSNAR